jgi:predicted CXXCH cytochrome family protein
MMLLRLLALFLLLLGLAAQSAEPGKGSRVPQPVIEAARGGQCVEEPAFMRRNHMELLKHQRDDTMRGGIRGAKYSLKTCIECHASQTTNSVTATQTNFCVSCHSYSAVKIDCFECHATQPQKTSFLPLQHPANTGTLAQLSQQLRQQVASQQVKP